MIAAMQQGHDRQPARQVHAVGRSTTRCRTFYLREVKGNNNGLRGIAVKALADPGARLQDVTPSAQPSATTGGPGRPFSSACQDRLAILNAVQYGLLLFLVASGLTLIFGIMGVINLAHGSFYMMAVIPVWQAEGLMSGA